MNRHTATSPFVIAFRAQIKPPQPWARVAVLVGRKALNIGGVAVWRLLASDNARKG